LNTGVSDGSLTLNPGGGFTYTPDNGFCGTDSFTYRANDGQASSNLATVSIQVACSNNLPVAVDDNYTTTEGILLDVAAPGVLANDSDADDDTLTAVLDTDVAVGNLTLNSDGSFVYNPPANFSGNVTFTYHVEAAGDSSNIATVTIVVEGDEGPPTFTVYLPAVMKPVP
jgi:VCBS repeat-containing protein